MMKNKLKNLLFSAGTRLTTCFSENEKHLKKRVENIMDGSKKRKGIIMIFIVLVLCLICGSVVGVVYKTEKNTEMSTDLFRFALVNGGNEYEISSTKYIYDKEVKIPATFKGKPVTSIADGAFEGRIMEKIIFPESIQHIGENAFKDCENLKSVELHAVTVGKRAFYGCNSLSDVTIAAGMTVLNDETFYLCRELKSVLLPSTLIEIGDSAFARCEKLETINFPFKLNSIGALAFQYCASLRELYFPKTLNSIGDSAFSFCASLESIKVEEGSKRFFAESNCLISINYDEKNSIVLGCKFSKIPENKNISQIDSAAFEGCSGLTEIDLPNGIESIGTRAFYGCTALEKASMADSISRIESFAFADCTSLSSVKLSRNIISFDSTAFRNSEQATENHSNVEYLGDWAITSEKQTPFLEIRSGTKAIADYAIERKEIIYLPSTLSTVCQYALWDNPNLKEIHFNGTLDQWELIVKPQYLTSRKYGYTIFCTDGKIEK